MDTNPYAPPQTDIIPPPMDAEGIRKEHLKTEAAIKTAGWIYLFVGFLWAAAAGFLLLMGTSFSPVGALFAFIMVTALVRIGIGLCQLSSWARIASIILSSFGLLAFPLGTVVNGIILAHVCRSKARTVMSPAYKQIIAETPHLRCDVNKTLIFVPIIMVVLVLAIGSSLTVKIPRPSDIEGGSIGIPKSAD